MRMKVWKWLYKYESGGYFWFFMNFFFLAGAIQTYVFTQKGILPLVFWSLFLIAQAVLITVFRSSAEYNLYKRIQGLELYRIEDTLKTTLEKYLIRLETLSPEQRKKELEIMASVDPEFKKHPQLKSLIEQAFLK